MQTIKTAVVVVLLLAIVYGVYVGLNGSETPLPPELESLALDFSDGENSEFLDFSSSSDFGVASEFQPMPSTQPAELAASNTPALMQPELAIPKTGGDPTPNVAVTGSPEFDPSIGISAFDSSQPMTELPAASPRGLGDTPSNTVSLDPPSDIGSSKLVGTNADSSVAAASSVGLLNEPSSANYGQPSVGNPGATTRTGFEERNAMGTPRTGLPTGTANRSFSNALVAAQEQISRGDYREALATLSLFYSAPELTHDERQELLDLLDPLAGEVIYSRNHHLDIAYTLAIGETMEDVARQFEVPAEILANINAIPDPGRVSPGTSLKVVPGPFRAEVDLKKNELTLFLGELYAGRFGISIGNDPMPNEGVFQVVDKQRDRNYYGLDGSQIAGADPRNPYGGYWLDLGQNLCIHGSASTPQPGMETSGCISLSPIDARDVFGMLGRGSQIQIR